MKIFARSEQTPVRSAELALARVQERRNRLATQVAQAQSELAQVKGQAASAALAELALEVSEIASDVATAQATLEALSSALDSATAEVVAAEQTLAHEKDREQRAESIAEVRRLIAEIEACSHPLTTVVAGLVKVLQRAAPITLDARNVCGFFEVVAADLPQMLTNAQQALEYHIHQIESGVARSTLPAPEITPVAVLVATPPNTVSVCLLFDARWRDPASGFDRFGSRGWDIDLDHAVAGRAIAAGVAIPSDSGQAKKLRSERGAPAANPDGLNLDDPAVAKPAPRVEQTINPHPAIWQPPGVIGARPWFGKVPS
jgi:hypothetical protein